jgi:hypothetical protein
VVVLLVVVVVVVNSKVLLLQPMMLLFVMVLLLTLLLLVLLGVCANVVLTQACLQQHIHESCERQGPERLLGGLVAAVPQCPEVVAPWHNRSAGGLTTMRAGLSIAFLHQSHAMWNKTSAWVSRRSHWRWCAGMGFGCVLSP